jgi:hypothetical protein
LPDHFFNLSKPGIAPDFFPVRFGTAKVETFFSFPKLIFFIFLSLGAGSSSSLYLSQNPSTSILQPLSEQPRFLVCGLQRCGFFYSLSSVIFTYFQINLLPLNLQKTTAPFVSGLQM